jgi:hypothetical protein
MLTSSFQALNSATDCPEKLDAWASEGLCQVIDEMMRKQDNSLRDLFEKQVQTRDDHVALTIYYGMLYGASCPSPGARYLSALMRTLRILRRCGLCCDAVSDELGECTPHVAEACMAFCDTEWCCGPDSFSTCLALSVEPWSTTFSEDILHHKFCLGRSTCIAGRVCDALVWKIFILCLYTSSLDYD